MGLGKAFARSPGREIPLVEKWQVTLTSRPLLSPLRKPCESATENFASFTSSVARTFLAMTGCERARVREPRRAGTPVARR